MNKRSTLHFNFQRFLPENLKSSIYANVRHPSSHLLPFLLLTILGATIATLSGADSSFDTLNYHFFNGWATLRSTHVDYLPTSIWTFFPSQLDFLYHLLWSNFPSVVLSAIIGGMQGFLGFLVYQTIGMFEEKNWPFTERHFFGTLVLVAMSFLAGLQLILAFLSYDTRK